MEHVDSVLTYDSMSDSRFDITVNVHKILDTYMALQLCSCCFK